MVIDKEEKDLFGEAPSKGDPSVLGEHACLGQVFLLKGAICLWMDI